MDSRRKFEADCHKLERWFRETALTCQLEVPQQCSLEVLKDQLKVFQVRLFKYTIFFKYMYIIFIFYY